MFQGPAHDLEGVRDNVQLLDAQPVEQAPLVLLTGDRDAVQQLLAAGRELDAAYPSIVQIFAAGDRRSRSWSRR
jgi:hypothetical protein